MAVSNSAAKGNVAGRRGDSQSRRERGTERRTGGWCLFLALVLSFNDGERAAREAPTRRTRGDEERAG